MTKGVWFTTQYDTYFNFEKMYDDYKHYNYCNKPDFVINYLIDKMIVKADENVDYETVVAIKRNREK